MAAEATVVETAMAAVATVVGTAMAEAARAAAEETVRAVEARAVGRARVRAAVMTLRVAVATGATVALKTRHGRILRRQWW